LVMPARSRRGQSQRQAQGAAEPSQVGRRIKAVEEVKEQCWGTTSRVKASWAFCITHPLSRLRSQLLQERLGFLEVGGVKALGELAVNRGEQLAGCGALALALPQARQAGGGASLEGLRLLVLGSCQSLGKTGACFRLMGQSLLQNECAFEAMAFCCIIAFPLCSLLTVTGHPAMAVLYGFTPEGWPVGVQIVGRSQDERGVLRFAHAFAQATGCWKHAPSRALETG
jgi:hypothetical protein